MNHPRLTTYTFWTTEEENLLRSLAGTMSFSAMREKYFPDRTAQSLQRKSTKMGLVSGYRHSDYSHDTLFWSSPNLINSYWAGASNADANLHSVRHSYTLQLQPRDRHHLDRLKETVKFTGPIATYRGYPTLVISGCAQWYKDLEEIWSITPAKTFTIQPPKITDPELIKAFLVGLYDGDGWITVRSPSRRIRLGLAGASLPMMEWVKDQMESLFPFYEQIGATPPRPLSVKPAPKGHYYQFCFDGFRALRVVHYLRQVPVPKLDRKWSDARLLSLIYSDRAKFPHLFT